MYEGVKIEPGTEIENTIEFSQFKAVVFGWSVPGQVKVLRGRLTKKRGLRQSPNERQPLMSSVWLGVKTYFDPKPSRRFSPMRSVEWENP